MLQAITEFKRAGIMLSCALLLAGCAEQSIRNRADEEVSAGHYEKALKVYDEGLARYPESVILKAGHTSTRAIVFSRLMTAASNARTAGDDKAAEEILRRAIALDPSDDRARSLLLDVGRDQRQKVALVDARELVAKGLRERALIVIDTSLKDNPRNPELLALQRKLELDARQTEMTTAHLAETRPISLDFRDASLRMVLEVLTHNSGINFVFDKDVRQDLRTTVFLRQTRIEDALELITSTSQLAYKVLDSATVLVYPKTQEKLREYQDLVIRAFYLSSADAKQTANLLKAMLKIRDPFVDEKLNMVVVRETPEAVRLAERLISLQDQAEPEVMMEVEVLEINRNSLTELGIKYPDSLTLTPIPPATDSGFTLGNLRNINRDSIGINVPSLTLNMHRDVGDVHLLANPQIRARNHEKAKVLIGDKLPIITTTGSAMNNGFISESVQYVDVGLKLDVEPTVYLDDEVAIRVGLEVSSLVNQIKTSAGSLVYQIGTRNASTVLRLHDGQTQLLAGLISNAERTSANRVPGIGDLPLIGRLFSSRRDDNQRTEIVLAITPRIVHNIRRPDLNAAEFWSGTENDLRSRPLVLPSQQKPAEAKGGNGQQPGVVNPAAPAASPAPGEPNGAPAAPSLPALKLVAPAEVKAGATFSVYVNLKSDAPIRGMPLQLEFTPQTLEVVEIEDGAFFKQDGSALSMTKTAEKGQGKASIALLRNLGEGAKGEGTAATVKFKALSAGPAEIKLVAAKAVATPPVELAPLPEATKIVVK